MKQLTAFLAIIFFGCSTAKIDSNRITKAQIRNPDVVALKCNEYYPIITKDSLITKVDTVFDFVEWFEPVYDTVYDSGTIIINRRTVKTINTLQRINTTQYRTIYDTRAAEAERVKVKQVTAEKDKYQKKSESRGEWIKWLLIAASGLALLNLLQLKIKR